MKIETAWNEVPVKLHLKPWVSLVILIVCFSCGRGLAANTSHQLDINVSGRYVSVSVSSDTISGTITADDFQNGLSGDTKTLTGNATISVWTWFTSCSLFVSGTNFSNSSGSSSFPVNNLQVSFNGSYHTLSTTNTKLTNISATYFMFQTRYTAGYRLINVSQLETVDPGVYQSVITYTAVTPAIE